MGELTIQQKPLQWMLECEHCTLQEMFDEANVTKDLILSGEEQEILNQRLIDMFPRIGRDKPEGLQI